MNTQARRYLAILMTALLLVASMPIAVAAPGPSRSHPARAGEQRQRGDADRDARDRISSPAPRQNPDGLQAFDQERLNVPASAPMSFGSQGWFDFPGATVISVPGSVTGTYNNEVGAEWIEEWWLLARPYRVSLEAGKHYTFTLDTSDCCDYNRPFLIFVCEGDATVQWGVRTVDTFSLFVTPAETRDFYLLNPLAGEDWSRVGLGEYDITISYDAEGAFVSGKVTDSQNNPLDDMQVRVFDSTRVCVNLHCDPPWELCSDCALHEVTAWTNQDGEFFARMLAGTYKVSFSDATWGTEPLQYYNNQTSLSAADDVILTAGDIRENVNASLPAPTVITGRVASGNVGVEDVFVELHGGHLLYYDGSPSFDWDYCIDNNWNMLAWADTDGNGNFTLSTHRTGDFTLRYLPPCEYVFDISSSDFFQGHETWRNCAALHISVAAVGSTVDVPALQAQRMAEILGRITGTGGAPLSAEFVVVHVYDSRTAEYPVLTRWLCVCCLDKDGYSFFVPQGTYYLGFTAGYEEWVSTLICDDLNCNHDDGQCWDEGWVIVPTYHTQYWEQKTSLATADSITVAFGQVIAGKDIALQRIVQQPPPPVNHTVTFNSQGGNAIAARTVQAGQAIGALPTPTRANHTFAGWWTAATGGTQVTASTVVNANMTIHARWISNAPIAISINPPASNIVVRGRTLNLGTRTNFNFAAGAAQDRTVTWTSSNTRVATVNASGVITGRNPGSVTITVRSTLNANAAATFTIRVEAAPSGINTATQNIRTIRMRQGATLSLPIVVRGSTAAALNNTPVTINWRTNNRNVVTLRGAGAATNDGRRATGSFRTNLNATRNLTLRAVRPGTTTIVLSSQNGRQRTIRVTVVRSARPVTNVRIAGMPSNNTMNRNRTRALTPRVTPTNATLQGNVRWTSSNRRVATVDGAGRVTARASGTTNITLRVGTQTHRVTLTVR